MDTGKPNPTLRKAQSNTAVLTGTGVPIFDPTGQFGRKMFELPEKIVLTRGTVLRTGVAGYDCSVKIGMFETPCRIVHRQSTQGFGLVDGELPLEGSEVLVAHREWDYAEGMIVGVIPRSRKLAGDGKIEPLTFMNYPVEDINPFEDNPAYSLPYEGEPKPMCARLWSNSEQWNDIFPGEGFVTNENRCGIVTSMYDVELTGGDSFIRIGRIDDEIRVRSTNFTKWTSHTSVKEFNDGGLISEEGREYLYQGEQLGDEGLKLSTEYKMPNDVKDKEPRPRTRWWRGFLGNLFSWFVVRPRKTKDEDDAGLASIHISQAGNVMARAAGGISLERYDAIPVPHRLKDEWDPEGDKEIDVTHDGFSSFNLSDPHGIGLLKSSKMAWEQKAMYQRFDELKKDFKVQQENEVKKLKNQDDDPFNSEELKLSEYAGRKAGVFIGEDGSVIIRDAWGSEIVMVGGNIMINTPGNVITTSNRNIVSIAGEGVVSRGKKAAEMSADEGIARIHAQTTVEIAGGTDKKAGGVLIESLGETMGVAAEEEGGDSAFIGGVVIKAEKSGVSLSAKNTYVTAQKNIMISSGDSEDSRNGNVFIAGENTVLTADKTAAMVVEANACLVSHSSALLVSDEGSAAVIGKSASILNGDQVPILWASIGETPDLSEIQDIWDVIRKENILEPYSWNNVMEEAMFSFRNSNEALTDTGLAPWKPSGEFRMYEPYWQVMKDLGVDTVTSTPVKIEPEEVHGSKCWPYKDAMESGKFIKAYVGNLNVEGSDQVSRTRDAVNSDISLQEESFLSDFTV